nr:hypothetical protein [Pseudomonas moraviensis]
MGLEGHAALQYRLCLHQQFMAAGGEGGAAIAAVEQLDAEIGFQVGNRRADGRLGLAQLAPGGGERAAFHHLDEHQQLIE